MKVTFFLVLLSLVALSAAASCPCKCRTKKAQRQKIRNQCKKPALKAANCVIIRCEKDGDKGLECCDGPTTSPTSSPSSTASPSVSPSASPSPNCPCVCKKFKFKANKACKSLKPICKVKRCTLSNGNRGFYCCFP